MMRKSVLLAVLLTLSWFFLGLTSARHVRSEIPALGREAQLGEFFDAVTESFLGQTLFKQRLSPSQIQSNDIQSLSSKSRIANTLGEKTTTFEFNVSLTFKICWGLIKITLTSGYLRTTKQSTTSDTMLATFSTRTVKDTVDLFLDDMNDLISFDLLNSYKATHIVIGVEYGSEVMVQLEDTNKFKDVKENSHGALGAIVKALVNIFEGKGPDRNVPGALSPGAKLVIKMFGDIYTGSNSPKTIGEVKNFIKQIPTLTKQYNGGKGKPVVYTLLPLDAIRRQFMFSNINTRPVYEIEPGLEQQFVLTAEQMMETETLLNELLEDIANSSCITQTDSDMVRDLNDRYTSYSEEFRNIVKETALKIREGSLNNSDLTALLDHYKSNPLSAENVYAHIREDFGTILEKLNMYVKFMQNSISVDYWNKWSSVAEMNPGRNVYILHYSPKLVKADLQAWEECSASFFRLGRASSNKMIVLDCDFPAANCPPSVGKVELHQYRSGTLISKDVPNELTYSEKLDAMKIPSLGRTRSLGDLYNANTGQFLSNSIFSRDIQNVDVVQESSQDSNVIITEQYGQKLSIAKIPEDVAVDTFLTDPELRGSWEYISKPPSPGKTTAAYFHMLRTGVDSVQADTFKESLQLPPAFESGATHFVHKIIYGATTFTEIELPEGSECDNKLFLQDLENLRNYTDSLLAGDAESGTPELHMQSADLKYSIFSDVTGSNSVTNEAGFKFYIQNLKKNIVGLNDGKGKPIAYILEPLLNYRVHFGVLNIEKYEPILTSDDYKQLVQNYNEIMAALMEVESWSLNFHDHSSCVQDDEKKVLQDIKQRLDKQVQLWKKEVKSAIDSRKPREEFRVFSNLTDHFKISKMAISNELEMKLEWTNEKIKLLKDGLRKNIGYSGRHAIDFTKSPSANTYVLHLKRDFKPLLALWWENILFFQTLAITPGNSLFYLDCDIGGSTCGEVTGPVVYEYKGGKITSKDFLADYWNATVADYSVEETLQNLGNLIDILEMKMDNMTLEFAEKYETSMNHTDDIIKYCEVTTQRTW